MEHEGDNYTNCDWCFWHGTKRLLKGLEDLEVGKFGIIENGQNTEKGPVDFRRLAVTQSPVKDHQLTLM